MMGLCRTATVFAAFVVLTGGLAPSGLVQTEAKRLSDADNASLSREMSSAVSRGDTPGVVALVVGRNEVLYEGAISAES